MSEVKEEGDDLPTQVAMVTEEDGAPQVALITQDGAQQVQAGGEGWGGPLWLVAPPSLWGAPGSNSPIFTQVLFFTLLDLKS